MSENNRAPFLYHTVKLLFRFYAFFFLGYRIKNRYKIKKGEKVLILSNHQTDYDPLLIHLHFNKFFYLLATDNIFASPRFAKVLKHFGAIPKRKGMMDAKSNMQMMALIQQGKSLSFFPEGNRRYNEEQFYIAKNIGNLIKHFECTLVLFNIHGGFGKYPRFGGKKRRGRFYGEVRSVLRYDDYAELDAPTLHYLITHSLDVNDCRTGFKYKSRRRAEFLERQFFLCPKCNETQTLYSKGSLIKCDKCGFEAEYTEDLHIKSHDEDVNITSLKQWYDYQKQYIKNHDISGGGYIFIDHDVKLYLANRFKQRKLLSKGNITLTKDTLIFDDVSFPLADIYIASPVSGRKLCMTINGNNYEVKGDKRFNALKYVLMFNKLDTRMKREKVDNYFTL